MYQPLESLIWSTLGHFLYLFFTSFIFSYFFHVLLNCKIISQKYEGLRKGTYICFRKFQSYTDPEIMARVLSDDYWWLSGAQGINLPHSNMGELDASNQEIMANTFPVYSWVPCGSEQYLFCVLLPHSGIHPHIHTVGLVFQQVRRAIKYWRQFFGTFELFIPLFSPKRKFWCPSHDQASSGCSRYWICQ